MPRTKGSYYEHMEDDQVDYVGYTHAGADDTLDGSTLPTTHRHRLHSGRPLPPKEPLLNDDDDAEEVYIVRQNHGYFSVLFSAVQVVILVLMMWQCGVAPMRINPMFGPYPDALSEWGGKNSVLILEDGHWWRLLTPILLHAGVIHIFSNVAVQLDSGAFFEKEWGSIRWLIIYLTSAVGSSILSVIIMPQAVSVGSSGAVMGLFGGKLAEVLMRMCEPITDEQERVGHQVRKEQCAMVTCSVIVVMLFSFIPYVDWAAHLGGLVAGLVVGIMVFACDISSVPFKIFWFLVGTLATVLGMLYAIRYMYSGKVELVEELRDVCGYYTENFEDYECNCMLEEYMNNFQQQGGEGQEGGGEGGGGDARW